MHHDNAESFDFIVVGGGSAGCIVASELSADPTLKVLLLECGDAAEDNPETLRADGYKDAFVNPRLMFERFSTSQRGCGDRRLFMGSGKGIGGSGAINAMVYTRGSKEDFAEWPEGWRWNDVVPHFEALEKVLRVHRREPTRFTETCIEAAVEAGFRRKEDLNDGDLSGVLGYEWMNYDGEARRSAYTSFLRATRERSNLTVLTGARAERIVFDAKKAVAVEFAIGDEKHRANVRREVVLSAGTLETPRLLMLSGVGPEEWLRQAGVPVVADVQGVGRNLHDHPNVQLFFFGKRAVDCNYPQVYGFHRAGKGEGLVPGQSDTCYVFYPARSSFKEGVVKLLPSIALPETLYDVKPVVSGMRGAIGALFGSAPARKAIEYLWGIVVILGKPRSRGTVRLRSQRPEVPADVDPAYFSHPDDMDALVRGVALGRKIARTSMAKSMGALEVMPGPSTKSDAAVAHFIRKNAMTTYHYAGTSAMGSTEASPVDTELRLRGVRNVRVADASVIPTTPVSALNAPSMMIGLRASRILRGW